MKKKILFVVDKPDWAYEFMVKAWLPFLQNEYESFITYALDYTIKKNNQNGFFYQQIYNLKSFFKLAFFKLTGKTAPVYFVSSNTNYYYPKNPVNKVYRFDRDLSKVPSLNKRFDIKVEMAFYFQYISEVPFTAKKNIVGIFTDIFPHEGPGDDIKKGTNRSLFSQIDFFENYIKPYDNLIVGGGNLLSSYQKLTDKVSFVYGIYGQDQFVENKNVGKNDFLTIGWTGNPARKMKGFEEYIVPAIENLKKTGRDIRLKTKFSGPYEDLFTFYTDVDLVIIASEADSGPSMYAEACLCAVPCVSTKVGLPLMGIKNNETGFLIDRDIEDIENHVKLLYDDRKMLQSMSKNVKTDYLKWMDNKIKSEQFKKVLEN
ncbi:MAG: glycosyltransferase [Weeksellaceae bacterium]|nr:glycosyltransferase [Weeksellaceae bacterium]